MHQKTSNISGIHNYCDRWCERCSFTSRCAVFKQLKNGTTEEQDIQNEAFWNRLSENFAQMHQTIHEAAQKWGIDLNALPAEEMAAVAKKQEDLRLLVKQHPLNQLCLRYCKEAREFLQEVPLLEEENEPLLQQVALGIQTEKEAKNLLIQEKECLEVIQWYLFFILAKFNRALSGLLEDEGWEAENGFPKDSDGSAKVALLAVERSIQAWAQLLALLPQAEDKILPLLVLLQKIAQSGKAVFPGASAFVRPGFDTA